MLLLLFNPQGAAAFVGVNLSDVVARLLPRLGAYRLADLKFWTEAELFRYADHAVKTLARSFGLWVERTYDTAVSVGNAVYSLPARHIATIHVDFNLGANLRPARVRDLEARDSAWLTTQGAVSHYVHDYEGTEKLRLYRVPAGGGLLGIVFAQYPAQITQDSPVLAAPEILGDYLLWAILAEARSKESDAAMPEVAEHALERLRLMEEVFKQYWGGLP